MMRRKLGGGYKRTMSDVLQLAVACIGVMLLVIDFMSFVYQKVTEGIGLLWFLLGIILILCAFVPGLNAWLYLLPKSAVPAFLMIGTAFLLSAFYISSLVSQLLRKNQELAMHVSLLNQENESILYELRELKELQKHENTVCH